VTAWAAALEAASHARVTLVIGPSDTGKTTLTTRVAAALAAHEAVAIVDADLGQSDIGPPTTIGLGRARPDLQSPGDAEILALEFVGATTPVADLRRTARATAALVERALAQGFARVLVDTCGMVVGGLARAVRRTQIDAVAPDLLVVLQRGGECEHVIERYASAGRPALLRLGPLAGAVRRTQAERRRHRERSLAAYFEGAAAAAIDLTRVSVEPATPGEDSLDALVGLRDARGETLGIGHLTGVDVAARRLTVVTPVTVTRVTTVSVGRERYRGR
jgi:polynucleotide 5'-hydroxyl-kinase GRC3/NOL9